MDKLGGFRIDGGTNYCIDKQNNFVNFKFYLFCFPICSLWRMYVCHKTKPKIPDVKIPHSSLTTASQPILTSSLGHRKLNLFDKLYLQWLPTIIKWCRCIWNWWSHHESMMMDNERWVSNGRKCGAIYIYLRQHSGYVSTKYLQLTLFK